jgi:hypothetical protein
MIIRPFNFSDHTRQFAVRPLFVLSTYVRASFLRKGHEERVQEAASDPAPSSFNHEAHEGKKRGQVSTLDKTNVDI